MTSKEISEKNLAMQNLGLVGAIAEKDVIITRLKKIVNSLEKTVRDVTKERDEFRRLAITDHLTAVPNRRRFEERAIEILLPHLNGSRKADHQKPCLVFTLIDIYQFKKINDTHGYDRGDEILRNLARSIQNCVRGEDAFGRFGGDEFEIFFEEKETVCDEDLFSFAQRISNNLLKKANSNPEKNESFGISVGIFLMREVDQLVWKMHTDYTRRIQGKKESFTDHPFALSLLKYLQGEAELLMKKAKSGGENRVCIGRYTNEAEERRLRIFERDL